MPILNSQLKGHSLVTGGAKGLGKALVNTLLDEGHSVYLHYFHTLPDINHPKIFPVFGDFSTQEGLLLFIEQIHFPVTHLVHNVGNILLKSGRETTCGEWEALYRLNFFSLLSLFDAFKENLESVTLIGVAGLNGIRSDYKKTAYASTKLAAMHWMKSLAAEGRRVNMLSPGELVDSVTLKEAKLPMGRPASYEEVCRGLRFFLHNPYITGQNLEISGGYAL